MFGSLSFLDINFFLGGHLLKYLRGACPSFQWWQPPNHTSLTPYNKRVGDIVIEMTKENMTLEMKRDEDVQAT